MGRGRVFSREFKLGVVRQVANGEKRPAQVCREHGLSEGLLLRWRREYAARGEAAFAPHQLSEIEALQRKVTELERLCGQLALENAVRKGAVNGFPSRNAMIAQAQRDRPELSVRRLRAPLGGGRGWDYERSVRPTQGERDVVPRDVIERIVLEVPGYGDRRVTKSPRRDGWTVTHTRVPRVLRWESPLCQLKRRFTVTTDSRHALPTSPSLAAELTPTGPDPLWAADITSIRLPTAFVSLARILAAWPRRRIGWELSRSIDTRLTLAARDQAVATRLAAPGLIHHSDQGVQYASSDDVARLAAIGAKISRAAVGIPYDNAKAESFVKTLKGEEVSLQRYRAFEEATAHSGHVIGAVSNAKRLHSSLGYRPSVEFEAAHRAAETD